jgi:glycosyltransferase involved in cell wall biosynthesis
LIENGNKSVVCYGRGNKIIEKNVYKIAPELIMKFQSLRSKLTGYAYAGCLYSTYKLIRIIKKERPDVVHLHCINGYMVNIYKLLAFLKYNNIPTVLTLHAEFMYTAGCGHAMDCEKWKTGCGSCPQKGSDRPSSKIFDRSASEWKLMKNVYNNYNNIVITSVSKWLHDRAIQSPFFADKNMQVVLNGIDTENVFKPTDAIELKKRYNIQTEKVVLHVTASFTDSIKGGKYVIELAQRFLHENIRFFIVGFNGDKSILPSNVTAIPNTKDQIELATFYTMADLTILTSLKETFSMICAESLACGTPVIGFEAGAPETISLKSYSEFVKQGDIVALESTVIKWLNKKQEFKDLISSDASNVYSKKYMYNRYYEIYSRIYSNRRI